MNPDSERLKQLSYLSFNFVATVAVTFINKICFSRVDFGFPATLCNIHFMVTFIGVEIMRRLGIFRSLHESKTSRPSLRDPNFLVICTVVGIVTPLNNTSLKLNSVGFYQIFKLLVTPGVVFLEYVLDEKVLSRSRALALTAVCLCVLVSSRADLQFSVYGTICASIWVPLAAAYKVQWGRVKKMYSCSTLQLMYAVLPYALTVQIIITPLVDPPGVSKFVWTKEAIFWIGLSGVAAFLVNFSGFLVMGNIGALAHVLLGQLKTAVIMIGSLFLFNSKYSALQVLGAIGAVLSIVVYTHVTVAEKAHHAKVSDSNDDNDKEQILPLITKKNSST